MKSVWKSRTIWVNLVAAVASIGMMFGLNLGLDAESQAAIVTGIMAIVNLVLRFQTDSGIALKPPADHIEDEHPTGV